MVRQWERIGASSRKINDDYVQVSNFQQIAVHIPKHTCGGLNDPYVSPCADIKGVRKEILATITGILKNIVP